MKNKFLIITYVILIGIGLYLISDFYQNVIHPLDVSTGILQNIRSSSEPELILSYAVSIKEHLPKSGNPVWIFPTMMTDFERIQNDLDVIIYNTDKISSFPADTSAFHTGMLDIHERSNILNENLHDIKPYLYVSIPNLLFNFIWLLGILGFYKTLMRNMQ